VNQNDLKQMKLPVIGVLLLSNIAFISGSQVAATEREAISEEAASIQILNLYVLPSRKVVLKCKNNGNKPIKAFKGKWLALDDFDEASQSDDILFTSSTAVTGSNAVNAVLGGYLIQPNSIIYLVNDGNQRFAMVGRLASDAFGNLQEAPPMWNKRFKAAITNVIFAEKEDVDNLHKQEEALREQERLSQQKMTRQAEDDAREAEQKRRFDQMITQSQTATREITRIPMEDSREHFIITDVSVEYRGARKDFRRPPNLHAEGARAIVEDGIYSYFANQADRDKALRIFNEAIKAWQKKFPEAVDALDAPAPSPALREQPPRPIRENQVSTPKPSLAPLSHESNPAEDFAQGKAFSKGEGVAQNLPEATRYYRRAADRGYAPAQHQLGVAYAKGWGVERNDEEAVIWYRKAAEQGLPEAQHDLGVRYILGLGTAKDIATGVEWYRKAAAQGWQESVVALQSYGAAAPPAALPPTAIVTGIAADDYLSVRSAPAMNSKELFRLSNDQKIQIRGDSVFNGDAEWVPISAASKQGWVRKKYLRPQ